MGAWGPGCREATTQGPPGSQGLTQGAPGPSTPAHPSWGGEDPRPKAVQTQTHTGPSDGWVGGAV